MPFRIYLMSAIYSCRLHRALICREKLNNELLLRNADCNWNEFRPDKVFTLYCRITRILLQNQSVAKHRHIDADFTRHTISSLVPRLFFWWFLYVVTVALERIWVKKPGEENNIKSDVEMSRVLGFATDSFRSNVRVILQYSVNHSRTNQDPRAKKIWQATG